MTNKSKHEFVFHTRTNITSERPTVDTHKMMAMVTSARSGKRKKETTKSWGCLLSKPCGRCRNRSMGGVAGDEQNRFKSKARGRTRNVASCGVGDCFRQRPTRSCFCSGPSPFGSRIGFLRVLYVGRAISLKRVVNSVLRREQLFVFSVSPLCLTLHMLCCFAPLFAVSLLVASTWFSLSFHAFG